MRRVTTSRACLRWTTTLGVAIACSGETPTAPTPITPAHPAEQVRIECVGDVRGGTMDCASAPKDGAANATRLATNGAAHDLVVGGQNVYVRLTSSNVTYVGDVFAFNTTVTNLIPQALGTTNGTTADANGIRVFFSTQPVATSGSGTIDFINPVGGGSMVDGFATFTQSNQPYYQWASTMLAQGQTTAQRQWRIHVPASVLSFRFVVYVDAAVNYPDGYVSVTPTPTTVRSGGTRQLTAVVRDALGDPTADQTVTWGTSASGTATVNGSGLVTGVADGSVSITATNGTRTGASSVVVATASAATTTISGANFSVGGSSTITVQAKRAAGTNLTVGGDAVVLATDLGAIGPVTDNGNGTYTASLTSTTSGTAHVTGTINSATIANPATIVVSSSGLTANGDTYPQVVVGNMSINSANIPYSALTNDVLDAGVTVSFAGNGVTSGVTLQGGTVSMTTSGPNRGQFTYEPAAGFTGTDQFTYTLTGGAATSSATVSLTVATPVWFIDNNAGACSSSCNGRLSHPFTSLASFGAANGGGGQNPAAGQTIFLYESAASYTGPVILLNNQKLVGQDASTSLSAITGITTPSGSSAFPVMNTGGNVTRIIGASGGVALATGASAGIYGLTVSTTGGTAIGSGASFGTLTFTSATPDVSITSSGGPALSLNTGAVAGGLANVTASGGTNVVTLASVTGSLSVASGTLTGSAAGPALAVSGGTANLTLGTAITQSAASAALAVTGRTGGTMTVSGIINCSTACTGVSVTANPTGLVSLTAGGSAISTGTSNAVTFTGNGGTAALEFGGANLAVNTTTARGLNFSGSGTVTVFGPNAVFTASAGGTPVFGNGFGTLNFTGAASSTGGPAFDLSSGAVAISGTAASTNSTGRGLNLANLSGGVGLGGTGVSGVTTTAVDISGGTALLALSFPITKTVAGTLINVSSHATGSITFSGALSCTGACTGITVQGNTSGTIAFTNSSKVFTTTTASPAVALTNNGGATVSFVGGGLTISTSVGTGFSATGGGQLTVEGNGNTIVTSGTGSGLVVRSDTIGALGLNFQTISTGPGASNGIWLDTTGTTGSLTVSGNGGVCTKASPGTCSGGIINGTTGANGGTGSGIFLRSTTAPSLSQMRVTGIHNNFGIYGFGVRGMTLDKLILDGTYGTANGSRGADSVSAEGAASFDELSGTATISNSYFANGNWSNVRVHNALPATTLTRLTLNSDEIDKTRDAAAFANAGFEFLVEAGTSNVTVQNTTLRGATRNGALFTVLGGTSDIAFNSNTMTQTITAANVSNAYNHVKLLATGIDVTTGTLTYAIGSNNLQGSRSTAILVQKDLGNWTMTGQVTNNIIGSATVSSGSSLGLGIEVLHATIGKHKILVSGNQVQQYVSGGLRVGMNQPVAASAAAHTGSVHITLKGNFFTNASTVNTLVDAVNFAPITHTGSQHTLCVNFANSGGPNTLTGYFGVDGAPYSIGDAGGGNAAGTFLKIQGLVGSFLNDQAGLQAAIDAAWGPPKNVTGGRASYVFMSTVGGQTVSSVAAGGVACDLFQ